MEAINLDLLPGAMPPIVHVSQGDVGRQFKIAIYDDTGAAYSLTGKTLSIVGHKGDGNVFQYAIPSSAISGNEVTITTEEQMTPAAGKALCEIRIEQNGTKLGTCNFVMDVEQGPADMGSVSISALYLIDALFQEATADVEASAASATAAANSAIAAANSATAAAGSATTATTKAGNAADSATAAANSATAAYNSANDAENAKSGCVIARNDCRSAEERANHYAEAATNSATAAASSATAASGYADAADTSADNAADYATAASGSATAAATSASSASASETAAETAETNAAASATAAAGSASNAATSESNASTSETNAANSATAASGSATSAATSATAAANSATAAATSESKIASMTVSSQSVPYTQSADVVKTEVGGVYNLDFKIPRGEPTSGHDVEANPTGVATGDLTKLGIDGTIYNVAGGGGNALRFAQQYMLLSENNNPNITGFSIDCKLIPAYYENGRWNTDRSGAVNYKTGFVAAANINWGNAIPNMEWTTPPASSSYPDATESKWTLSYLMVTYYYDDNTVVGQTPFKDMSYVPIIGAVGTDDLPAFMCNAMYESANFSKYTQSITDNGTRTGIMYTVGQYGEDVPNNYSLVYPSRYAQIAVVVC